MTRVKTSDGVGNAGGRQITWLLAGIGSSSISMGSIAGGGSELGSSAGYCRRDEARRADFRAVRTGGEV